MRIALLCLLLLQEKPADILKKVEEAVGKATASSVRATVTVEGKAGTEKTEQSYAILYKTKGDGMALIEMEGRVNGKAIPKVSLVSDGKKVKFESGGQKGVAEHQLALGTLSRKLWMRAGLFASMNALFKAAANPLIQDLEKVFLVGEVAAAADEKVGDRPAKVFALTLISAATPDQPIRGRVWIDPEKNVVLKRETILNAGREAGVITETYTDLKLDADLPDTDFTVTP